MDHALHQRLTESELTDAVLSGATIYGPGDENVGTVSHLHGSGASAEAIIDVGGFLGIGAKPVAIRVSEINFMRVEDGTVHRVTRHRLLPRSIRLPSCGSVERSFGNMLRSVVSARAADKMLVRCNSGVSIS
ncbi:PRC-barrel domain-containing protein [Paracoccus litorisediminis]|uniref:PRC-barrel domain-containing protein n=1 Tax=Paracoccus litorisediminis TaxID=2006130 RepID=UPI001FEC33D9|nr:PRC-barrel domain-containing protein [Paracoccus litorisediminis]